jgi:hypothetical protein
MSRKRTVAPDGGEPQLVLFESMKDVDAHAKLVLSKEAEVESAQEAKIGRQNELEATPAWEAQPARATPGRAGGRAAPRSRIRMRRRAATARASAGA